MLSLRDLSEPTPLPWPSRARPTTCTAQSARRARWRAIDVTCADGCIVDVAEGAHPLRRRRDHVVWVDALDALITATVHVSCLEVSAGVEGHGGGDDGDDDVREGAAVTGRALLTAATSRQLAAVHVVPSGARGRDARSVVPLSLGKGSFGYCKTDFMKPSWRGLKFHEIS